MPELSPSTALTARDARHEALSWALNEGRQTTAFLSLNLPGTEKSPPGSAALFAWALQEIADHFPETILHEQGQDVLGHYAILLIDHAPRTVKQVAIALETRHAAARLIDGGKVVSPSQVRRLYGNGGQMFDLVCEAVTAAA